MFTSLLIANRGEIACRIIATARRLGIRTIAVYSDADAQSRHVALADEAVRLGAAPASESYLDAQKIIDAARRTGAEAIHPGYGFLSERAILPQMCAEAGIVFVGPSAAIIETMGSKIGAKSIAEGAGVSGVPGYGGDDQSDARFCEEAERIGYPLMVKASAGGGGKGMRRVFEAVDLVPALQLARQEAQAAFGDPTLLLERLLLRPRHLEVQVAGDRHGNVVHLFERDCSVQRNNQKLLEEAPAPNLPPAVRARLLSAGVAVAKAVRYDNVGTVEFILGECESEPYFLEMNTRLQVEHTVTEAITGEDLVEWQLRIAAGEPLPSKQDDIVSFGHAIEARVTAERADKDFRPDAGTIVDYEEPTSVRVDSGVAAGATVTLFYDSLLSKVIAFGDTREAARVKLEASLRSYRILGPATTTAFLADCLTRPLFAEGRASTSFIAEAFPDGWKAPERHRAGALQAAAILALTTRPAREREDAGRVGDSAWTRLPGFRTLAPAGAHARLAGRIADADGSRGEAIAVSVLGTDRYAVTRGGSTETVRLERHGSRFTLHGETGRTPGIFHDNDARIDLALCGEAYAFRFVREVDLPVGAAGASGQGEIVSPMPGVVAEMRIAEGDSVAAGAVVAVLESMKLFVPVKAESAGIAGPIRRKVGETVSAGDLLVAISPRED